MKHTLAFAIVFLAVPAAADDVSAPDTTCFDSAVAGQKARKAGELTKARSAFLQCAQAACPAEVTARCTTWVTEVDGAMPSILVEAEDEHGADLVRGMVRVDGTPRPETFGGQAVILEPGTHVVRLEVSGRPPVEQSIVLREQEKNRRVVLRLAAPPHRPIHPFVFGGVGLASLAAFGAFATIGLVDRHDSRCDVGCNPSAFERVHTELVAADIALAVGAGLVAVALVDYLVTRPRTPSSRAAMQSLQIRF